MHTFKFKYHPLLLILLTLTFIIPLTVSGAATGTSSLLSQGRWVKVHVDTTSVYRIPYTMLRDWGFSDPDKIIVAGYGSVERAHTLDTAPDDLPILPVYRNDDAIYFYAEGDMRLTLTSTPGASSIIPFTAHHNYYSSGSYYFIGERDGLASPDMEPSSSTADSGNTTTISTHYLPDHHVYRENHPATHGLFSYSRNISETSPRTIDFDITDQAGSGVLYYTYIYNHSNSTQQVIDVNFSNDVTSIDGTAVKLTKVSTTGHVLYKFQENSRFILNFADDAEHFSATFCNPSNIFSTLALSSHTFIYKRNNRVAAEPSTLYLPDLPTNATVSFQGILSGLMAWDVTEPRSPKNLTVHSSSDGISTIGSALPSSPAVKIHTFFPSSDIPTPQYIGEVPAQDLHTIDGVDLLIVTTEATYAAALRLAEAHEQWQGMKVCVVRQEDVFNEFSSGALHPNGLRQFVKKLANSDSHRLRYLMLFGHGSWDSRATFDHSGNEYMVMYSTENTSEQCDETQFYCSDLYFGTLSDRISTSLATMRADVSISVGRVPASDASAAEAYVDKCVAYLSDPVNAGHFNHAIISGGIGDSNQHLDASENIGDTIKRLTISPTLNRAHLSLFTLSNPQTVTSEQLYTYLDSRLGGDSRLFSYTGHSSRGLISHTSHNIPREESMAYGSLPVVYMSSCSTTPIDIPEKSLGETMILHSPGPIAVIGAGGEVYLNRNITLNNRFIELFYTPDGGECIGDVFRLAVNDTKSTSPQFINNLCYNFLGDPALPRYIPEATVNVISIGETDNLTDSTKVQVPALSKTHISGNITLSDGKVDTSFCGKLYINIYNTPYNRTTLKHDSSDEAKELTIDEDVLYASTVNVENGLWSTDITLPTVGTEGTNRMTLNAISTDRVIASGGNEYLSVSTTAAPGTTADTTPPTIRLWLDSPDYTDGAVVSSSPTLYIEITDNESGTDLNSSAIGMKPKVSIDGTSIPAAPGLIRAEDEGIARGTYPLSNLADGQHYITVTARDIAGNSASETLNFTVITVDTTAALALSDTLVREDITFTLNHSLPIEAESQRLVIRDMEGRTVLSTDNVTYPYTWDFTGSDGFPVSDGTYRASVFIKAHPYYTATPEVEFTIVKK